MPRRHGAKPQPSPSQQNASRPAPRAAVVIIVVAVVVARTRTFRGRLAGWPWAATYAHRARAGARKAQRGRRDRRGVVVSGWLRMLASRRRERGERGRRGAGKAVGGGKVGWKGKGRGRRGYR